MSMLSFIKNINKNTLLIGAALVGVVIVGVLIFAGSGSSFSLSNLTLGFGASNEQIAKKAVDYINSNGLSSETVSLVSASEESGLIKIKIKVGTQDFESYVTKDGKILFPDVRQAIDMTAKPASASAQTPEQIIAAIKKTDKPALEAFIVSRCPFGLQMQRMIADAIKSVPSLADFIKVRYIGSVSSDGKTITSMHDSSLPEGKENLRQICIREEQPAKYWNYVACQMKSGDTTGCEKSTGVDSSKLNSCVSTPSKGLAYAQKDFDLSDKSGASNSGSPTLVLDGTKIPEFTADKTPVFGSGRSSDEIKTIICDASKTKPSFCSKTLNTTKAATGFSATYEDTTGTSGNTGANCAPAQ